MTQEQLRKVEEKQEELYRLGGPIFVPGFWGIVKAVAVMLVRLEERLEKLEGQK